MRLDFQRRTLRFAQPISTSYGELSERDLLTVTLTGDDGVVGHGEAAPLQPYDGVSIERVESALERYVSVLVQPEGRNEARMICPRRWRRSIWRCGIARAKFAGCRLRS